MQRYKKENKTILFIKLILLLFLYHGAKNRHLKQKQVKKDKQNGRRYSHTGDRLH